MDIIKLSEQKDIKTKNIKMLLYGDTMVGKTTLASTFPKPFILSTDGNIKNIESPDSEAAAVIISDEVERKTGTGMVIKESGWLLFKQLVDGLIKQDEVETIVVDLIKDVYAMARQYVLKSVGITHESEDNRMGRIWALLDSEFLPTLRKLMTSNKNVILITHEKQRDGKTVPNMIETLTQKVQSYSDIVGHLTAQAMPGQETQYTLAVTPSLRTTTGNRLGLKENIDKPTYKEIIKQIKGEK